MAIIITAGGVAVAGIVTAAITAAMRRPVDSTPALASDVEPVRVIPNDPNAPIANEETGRFLVEGQGEHRRDLEEMGLRVEEVRQRVRSLHDAQKGSTRAIVNIQVSLEQLASNMESLASMAIQHDTTSMQVRQLLQSQESQTSAIARVASQVADEIARIIRLVVREEVVEAMPKRHALGDPRTPKYEPPKSGA
jgi:hypothetical protein